ncbi:MAG: hypothetical protein JSW21_00060 [Gammaproteobacteria bacterium]|nr:MAG: hypothetical protein JSW21_00060 [Gammaproteobacteria bacterium]
MKGISWLLRIVAVCIAVVHTTAAVLNQSMNEDGINYLDMGDAWMRGDWIEAINGVWSPLYSVVLGVVVNLFQPATSWEFPVVQVTNLFLFLVALACFEFFWSGLTRRYQSSLVPTEVGFHPLAWVVLGYSLFIWTSLNLIEIWAVTPDMCVAALVYLSAGLLLRQGKGPGGIGESILFGLILGLAYLAKAALFVLGLTLLVLWAIAGEGGNRQRLRRAAISLAGFVIVAAPFLTALSLKTGTVTFSQVGTFTYLKHVNGMNYPYPRITPGMMTGNPEHPPRQVLKNPPVFEFATPVGGTYPLAFDPGYWTAGIEPVVVMAQQGRALIANGVFYFDLFVRQQGLFLGALFLLLGSSFRRLQEMRFRSSESVLVLWGLAALAMYSLVYVIPRYVAPFVLLLLAVLTSFVRLPESDGARRVVAAGGAIMIIGIWLNIAALNLEGLAALTGMMPDTPTASGQFSDGHHADHPAIAEELGKAGVDKGARVAFVGYSFPAYWARLARVQIVAEIDPEEVDRFWLLDSSTRSEVIDKMSGTPAEAVIAEPFGLETTPEGWLPLGSTGYLLRYLK